MELGSLIDEYYSKREARLAAERGIKDLKEAETALKFSIMDLLRDSGLKKATGEVATASIRTNLVPYVEDWDLIHSYIKDNDRFDLLQKRLSVTAWRDLHETGVNVPGTTAVEDEDLSLTKASRG
jgi:hypothetical protein